MGSWRKFRVFTCVLSGILGGAQIFGASNAPLTQMGSSETASKGQTAPAKKARGADQPKPQDQGMGAGSGLQVVRGPDDMATNGDCLTRTAALVVRASKDGVKGVRIAGGALADPESKASLPSAAFELLQHRAGSQGCENGYGPIPAEVAIPKDALTTLYLRLLETWRLPGNYTGDLLIAAQGTTGAETIRFKVFFRPRVAWCGGFLAILAGSLLSWAATIWWPRRRQMAINEVLISRLVVLLDQLRARLEQMSQVGAPPAGQTLGHIESIRSNRLRQLLDDKLLTVLTGGAPAQPGSVGVIEEIEGVTRVVNAGFGRLLELWQSHPGQQGDLREFFPKMDALGARVGSKDALERDITSVVDQALAKASQKAGVQAQVPLSEFGQEDAVVHRVVRATALLDVASIVAIVFAGMYLLIWKNPGFGSAGDLFVAFFWGLGLKIGADSIRVVGGDVRKAMGIKIPSP